MKNTIRVAIMQAKPYSAFDDPKNLGHALMLMDRLRGEALDAICFPEYFPFQGEEDLAAAAKRAGAYLIAGLVEEEEGKLYNTATLFDREGRLAGRQRKRNVGAMERDLMGISPGDGEFRVFPADFGNLGMPVCIDFWGQPEAARDLVDQGADVIFNPSIFPLLRGHWKTGALVRAFDNFLPVVGVNTADYNLKLGKRRIHQHGGRSFVIHPPRMLDREDFQRWFRSLDHLHHWVQTELEALEEVRVVEVELGVCRKFRREFWNRFGIGRRGSV